MPILVTIKFPRPSTGRHSTPFVKLIISKWVELTTSARETRKDWRGDKFSTKLSLLGQNDNQILNDQCSVGTQELELNLTICNKHGQQNVSRRICPPDVTRSLRTPIGASDTEGHPNSTECSSACFLANAPLPRQSLFGSPQACHVQKPVPHCTAELPGLSLIV